MKRFIPFLALALIFLVSCSDDSSTNSGNTPSANHSESYFPLDGGNNWTYALTDSSSSGKITGTIQIKLIAEGVKNWYNDGGVIAVLDGNWQTYNYQELFSDTSRNETMWYLTNYLNEKYSWGIDGDSSKVISYRMVNFADSIGSQVVTTNLGNYTCRVVVDNSNPGETLTYYVAKGVGIIKETIISQTYSSTRVLTSYNIK